MNIKIYDWLYKECWCPNGHYVKTVVDLWSHPDKGVLNEPFNKTIMNLLLAGF